MNDSKVFSLNKCLWGDYITPRTFFFVSNKNVGGVGKEEEKEEGAPLTTASRAGR